RPRLGCGPQALGAIVIGFSSQSRLRDPLGCARPRGTQNVANTTPFPLPSPLPPRWSAATARAGSASPLGCEALSNLDAMPQSQDSPTNPERTLRADGDAACGDRKSVV